MITVPEAPAAAAAIAGDGRATLTFDAPADGGSPILGYSVNVEPGGGEIATGVFPVVIDGLTNGVASTFSVSARNVAGRGEASSFSPVVSAGAPGAPTVRSVTPGGGSPP